jgi:hypothetical protein
MFSALVGSNRESRKTWLKTRTKGASLMATKTRRQLLDEIGELKDTNEELQEQLDRITDIVAPPEEEPEDDD